MATVPHSSFRATVPQGKVLGIHEGEVVERGECDVHEEDVENACETDKDDIWLTDEDDGLFMARNRLTLCYVLSPSGS